jgi:hypothetical protein
MGHSEGRRLVSAVVRGDAVIEERAAPDDDELGPTLLALGLGLGVPGVAGDEVQLNPGVEVLLEDAVVRRRAPDQGEALHAAQEERLPKTPDGPAGVGAVADLTAREAHPHDGDAHGHGAVFAAAVEHEAAGEQLRDGRGVDGAEEAAELVEAAGVGQGAHGGGLLVVTA